MVGSRRDRPRGACFEPCEARLPLSAEPPAPTTADAPAVSVPDPWSTAETLRRLHDDYQLTGAGQTVVVIDSGIAYDHPALGNGFGTSHHVVGGWDFTGEWDADPYDDGPAGFHGTHVAGIIGSLNPQSVGVAPGADLIALRVFDDQGRSDFAWIENALQWVHAHRDQFDHPITTVNLSIGLLPQAQLDAASKVLEDEFARLVGDGIFISVAAGNGYDSNAVAGLSYPASSPSVVPVGSATGRGELSEFSRRDPRMLAAPGEAIRSTITDFLFDFNGTTDDWYAFSGTSQAAPYVTGAAVLVRQAMQRAGRDDVDQEAIYEVLRGTADWIDDETGRYAQVDLLAAVESVLTAAAQPAPVELPPGPVSPPREERKADAHAQAIELGAVGFTRLPDVVISDEAQWYRLSAARAGRLAIEMNVTNGALAKFELYDAAGRQVLTSSDTGDRRRIEWTAAEGDSFHVRLQGEARGPLTCATLDTRETPAGLTVVIPPEVEHVTLTRGAGLTLELDGLSFQLPATATAPVEVHVQADDHVTIRTSEQDAMAYLRPVVTDIIGPAGELRVQGSSFVSVHAADGHGGQARLYGAAGADRLVASLSEAALVGADYRLRAANFERVYAFAGDGPNQAELSGSVESDVLVVRPEYTRLSNSRHLVYVESFERIVARGGDGLDRAFVYGSSDSDSFTASAGAARMTSGNRRTDLTRFERVYATAGPGGHDIACLVAVPAREDDVLQAIDFLDPPSRERSEWGGVRGGAAEPR